MNSGEDVPLVYKPSHRAIYRPAMVAAIGGIIFGFDLGAITGIIAMPMFRARFFRPDDMYYLQGVLVASFLVTAACGAFASGFMCDRLGRRNTILVSSVVFALGILYQVIGATYNGVIIGRLVAGFGAGLMMSAIPLYQTEIAPPAMRGRLINLFALLAFVGQTVGYFVDFGTSYWTTDWCWRVPLLIHLIGCVCFGLLAAHQLPYSPHWLAHRGETKKALDVLVYLHGAESTNDMTVRRELDAIFVASEQQHNGDSCSLRELFNAHNRKRTFISFFIATAYILSGQGTLCFFAPEIFRRAGLTMVSVSLAATGGIGLVSVVASAASMGCIDSWGRRPLFIGGSAIMALCMLTLGISFHWFGHLEGAWVRNMTIASIYLFCITHSFTWGVANYVYTAELFNMRCRAKGLALASCLSWVISILVIFYTPMLVDYNLSGVCFFYSVCNLVSFTYSLFLPETKGRTLEEIEGLFASTKAI